MKTEDWLDEIILLLPPHYQSVEPNNYFASIFAQVVTAAPPGKILLLKRSEKKYQGVKTVLVASVSSLQESSEVIHWAANVRDFLPEPHSSDIYLFLNIKNVSDEDCNRLEADELYCRKYVKRPEETTDSFIKRTFLALPTSSESLDQLSDPISASFSRVSEKHQWLSKDIKKAWRHALLSDTTPQELVEALFEQTLRD